MKFKQNLFDERRLRSIDDVLLTLEALDHELYKADLAMLRNFNHAYLVITRNVRQQLRKGLFEHPDFLEQFDIRFVGYYLTALEEYLKGQSTVPAWQKAFDKARHRQTSPLLCMALGVNAHVNNDIPQVLKDCGAHPKHWRDFKIVNDIIYSSITEVIDSLDNHKQMFSPKKKLLHPVYKEVMRLLIVLWRRNAWHAFKRLQTHELLVKDIEKSASRLAGNLAKIPV